MSGFFKTKNIFGIIASLILALTATSCRDDIDLGGEVPAGPVLTLSTVSSMTRGDSHYDDDEYAENIEEAIFRVDLFFFSEPASADAPFYVKELRVNRNTTADLSVSIPGEYIDYFNVVNEKGSGYVYALVNLPESVEVDEAACKIDGVSATLENISEYWVTENDFVDARQPESFVMRGGASISVEKDGEIWKATGYVPIERLAAKVRVFVKLPETIYIDTHGNTMTQGENESDADWEARKSNATEVWEPAHADPNGDAEMMLYFYNAALTARIDGDPSERQKIEYGSVDHTPQWDEVARRLSDNVKLNDVDKDETYSFSHEIPYYSYPNRWESNSPAEERNTYVMLAMPWMRVDDRGGYIQTHYYQVPVNALKSGNINPDCLESNKYYRIKITVGTLGSTDYGNPSVLGDVSYEVLGWVNAGIDVSIKDRRYLVVNEHNWTMNNIYTIQIPFSTSHNTIVTGCYVTYFRYNDAWGTISSGIVPADKLSIYKSHNKTEYTKWLDYADVQLADRAKDGQKGRDVEGPIRMYNKNTGQEEVVDGKKGDILYYKNEYFYDKYNAQLGLSGGYHYYVGHEHPITFQPDYVKYSDAQAAGVDMSASGWDDYNMAYDNINAVYTCDIDPEKSVINFRHPLIQWEAVRDGATKDEGKVIGYKPVLNTHNQKLWDEFSRVEIAITIRHEDWTKGDGLFEETAYITQYPGMYITVSHNYGDIGNAQGSQAAKGNRYVMINGMRTTSSGFVNAEFCMIDELPNHYQSNTNPNMYLIHTTQLSEDINGNYEIGDPRTLYWNNFLSTNAAYNQTNVRNTLLYTFDPQDRRYNGRQLVEGDEGNLFDGENYDAKAWSGRCWGASTYYSRDIFTAPNVFDGPGFQLRYYYPTDEVIGAGSKENFIAPVFRVASSYGRVNVNGRAEMRRRCASYQEAGRPAGRWRMPTKAEVKYIAQLSTDGKIPILFGSTENPTGWGYYWTGQGGVQANGNDGTVQNSLGDPNNNYPDGVMATRCVYDEWYWNMVDGGEFAPNISGPLETTFYWGDKLKDIVQPVSFTKRKK